MRVNVGGPIGAGKTSTLREMMMLIADGTLQLPPGIKRVKLLCEDVDAWEKEGFLRCIYSGARGGGAAMQMRVLLSFAQRHVDRDDGPDVLVIYERSAWDAHRVFLPLLRKQSRGSDWMLLRAVRNAYSALMPQLACDYQVMLSPQEADVCVARAQERGRPSESSMKPEYMRRVWSRYEHACERDGVRIIRSDDGKRRVAVTLWGAIVSACNAHAIRTLSLDVYRSPGEEARARNAAALLDAGLDPSTDVLPGIAMYRADDCDDAAANAAWWEDVLHGANCRANGVHVLTNATVPAEDTLPSSPTWCTAGQMQDG